MSDKGGSFVWDLSSGVIRQNREMNASAGGGGSVRRRSDINRGVKGVEFLVGVVDIDENLGDTCFFVCYQQRQLRGQDKQQP